MNENFDIDLDLLETAETSRTPEADRAGEAEDILYVSDEKASPLYETAIKAVVFGSLSVILPLIALIIYAVGMGVVSIAVAAVGLVFAVVALRMSGKCRDALEGSLIEGFAKAGRAVSTVGLIIAAVVLTYIVVSMVISLIMVAIIFVIYIVMYVITILVAIMTGSSM